MRKHERSQAVGRIPQRHTRPIPRRLLDRRLRCERRATDRPKGRPWRDHYRCSSPVPPPTWATSCTRFSTRIRHIRRRLLAVFLRSERSGSSSCIAQFFRFDPKSCLSGTGGRRSRTCASRATASALGAIGPHCRRCRLRVQRRCSCTRRSRDAIAIIPLRPAACCLSSSRSKFIRCPLPTPMPRDSGLEGRPPFNASGGSVPGT